MRTRAHTVAVFATLVLALAVAFQRAPSLPVAADSESSYRLRLAALTLATGAPVDADQFLGAREPAASPWPFGVHGMWGLMLRRTSPAMGEQAARGELSNGELVRRARGLDRWLFVALPITVALAVLSLAGSRSAAALAALLAAALSRAPGLQTLPADAALGALTCLALACIGWRARVSSVGDIALAHLCLGLVMGLLVQAAAVSWLALVAFALYCAQPTPGIRRPDRVRASALMWVGCAAVLLLPAQPLGAARPWPEWTRGLQGWLEHGPRAAILLALWLPALASGLSAPRRAQRTGLFLLGGVYALLAAFDARFAPIASALLVVGVGVALAILAERQRRRAALALAGGVLAAVAAGILLAAAPRADDEPYVAGLEWLRTSTVSPGPWNHPRARPQRSVLCSPMQAGNVTFHARRPVVAAAIRGVPASAAERAAAAALLSAETSGFAGASLQLGADTVVVAARDLDDRRALELLAGSSLDDESWQRSVLAQLVAGEPVDGLERIYASAVHVPVEGRSGGVPALSVYRVADRPAALR